MDSVGQTYWVIAVVAVVAAMVGFWYLAKKSPKAVLLVVGVGLWVLGQAVGAQPIREMKLIGGIFQLSGFIGSILGLIDLVRRRPESKK